MAFEFAVILLIWTYFMSALLLPKTHNPPKPPTCDTKFTCVRDQKGGWVLREFHGVGRYDLDYSDRPHLRGIPIATYPEFNGIPVQLCAETLATFEVRSAVSCDLIDILEGFPLKEDVNMIIIAPAAVVFCRSKIE